MDHLYEYKGMNVTRTRGARRLAWQYRCQCQGVTSWCHGHGTLLLAWELARDYQSQTSCKVSCGAWRFEAGAA